MSDAKLRFDIGSVFHGEGFDKARTALQNTTTSVQKAASGIGAMTGELGKLDGQIGKVAGGAASMLSAFAAGPIGVAVAGIGLIINKIMELREEFAKMQEDSANFGPSMEEIERGYARRIEKYNPVLKRLAEMVPEKREDLAEAEDLAKWFAKWGETSDREAKAHDRLLNAQAEAAGGGNQIAKAERATKQLSSSHARERTRFKASEHYLEREIEDLTSIVSAQKTRGLEYAAEDAKLLEKTRELDVLRRNEKAREEERQAELIEAQAKEVKAREDAAKAEEEAAKKAEEDKKKAAEVELKAAQDRARKQADEDEKSAKLREKNALAALDVQIASAKKAADAWEQEARTMRGKTFGAWLAEDAQASQSDNSFAKANRSADRRASRIRGNARHGWASARELEWLAKYDKWSAAQDPENNKAAKSVEQLEADRAKVVEDIKAEVADIKGKLENALTVE